LIWNELFFGKSGMRRWFKWRKAFKYRGFMGIGDNPKKIKKTLVVVRMYDNLFLPLAHYATRDGKKKVSRKLKQTVDSRC
jgi:hypothetical protein